MKKKIIVSSLVATAIFIAGYLFVAHPKSSQQVAQSSVNDSLQSSPPVTEKSTEEKYDLLKRLSPEVQIFYFEDFLGRPTYINYFDGNTAGYEFLKQETEINELREYIFTDKDYFVQAITDKRDKVLSFAVTSRKQDFNPTFSLENTEAKLDEYGKVVSYEDSFRVSLNKTPFSEWLTKEDSTNPLACYRFTAVHDPMHYFEQSYFGNPGNYLTYLVGINNSAPPHNEVPKLQDGSYLSQYGKVDCESTDRQDRERLAPNTYIVRGLSFSIDISEKIKTGPGIFFGPDPLLVRTLND